MIDETAEHRVRGGSRSLLAACAVLAIGLGLLAYPAERAQARPALGVATLDFPTAGGYQLMSRGGLQTAKLSIFWGRIVGSPGAPPDWSSYDLAFAAAADAGIRIIPLLHGSPPWINRNFQRPPLGKRWKVAAWQQFIQQFAARYGHQGTFWRANPSLPYLPPDFYEIWNEPNLNYFFGGKPKPGKYLKLLRATRPALKAGDPQGLVMVGGLYEHARKGFGTPASIYLRKLYKKKRAKKFFDAVAIHPYAIKPKGVVRNVRMIRRIMRRHRDKRTPIVITEFGWTVGGARWAFSPFHAKLGQQAKRLKVTFRQLLRRPGLGLSAILWYSWQDGAENLWIYRMGLFNRAGQPRPAWAAYARVAGGTP